MLFTDIFIGLNVSNFAMPLINFEDIFWLHKFKVKGFCLIEIQKIKEVMSDSETFLLSIFISALGSSFFPKTQD